MEFEPQEREYLLVLCRDFDSLCTADNVDAIYSARKKLKESSEPNFDSQELTVLEALIHFQDVMFDCNIKALYKKLMKSGKTLMRKLGSLLNDRIYGPRYDEKYDPRKDSEFYDRLEPFVSAVADIFVKGEAWAEANEEFIKLLAWADCQGWDIKFLFEWYKDIEELATDACPRERGTVYDFNAAVAQE